MSAQAKTSKIQPGLGVAWFGALRRKPWARVSALVVFAVLPKCPLCVLAMFGLLGGVAVGSWIMKVAGWPWMPFLGLAVLSVVVVGVTRGMNNLAAVGAAAGAGVLWMAKFVWGAEAVVIFGTIALGLTLLVAQWVRAAVASPSAGSLVATEGATVAPVCGCARPREASLRSPGLGG